LGIQEQKEAPRFRTYLECHHWTSHRRQVHRVPQSIHGRETTSEVHPETQTWGFTHLLT
jgi:hypothetical protein